jgi:beta-galactosidase
MNQWGGRTWYRKQFNAPASWSGKQIYIEFEAVRQIAEVYLNGILIGRSQNGFIPFGFDLTPHIKPGTENVLALMCDNSFAIDDASEKLGGKKETDVDYSTLDFNEGDGKQFPWNNPHWHPAHGGIYRNVKIHLKNPAHFTLPLFRDLGTAGSYVYASDISREQATVHVEAEVVNLHTQTRTLHVHTTWKDQQGRVVAEAASEPRMMGAGEKAVFLLHAVISKPLLWEPEYANLYQVENSLYDGGELLDQEEIPLGIRTVQWTTHAGFLINGRHMKLHGWGQKSTSEWPGLGAAQPDWMHELTLRLMRDAGGNFVRWGHTAGSPAQIASADRLGLVTLQPGVDGEADVQGAAWQERVASFRDMVIYFRNHPSILIWEGGNQSVSDAHAKELTDVVKTFDPHGGRAYAHRRSDAVTASYCDLTISTEGSGFRKELPTVEGEYNREESPRRVWDNASPPDFGYKNAKGTYQLTSEQFAINQIFQYDKISPLFHGGGANWIFSDSTSGGRVQSEVARASGEVDGVRLPKEAWSVCKVLFTDEPDLHLIGHWTYPENTVKDLFVASDCEEVELFLNGQSLGRKNAYTGPSSQNELLHRNLFVFPSVKFQAGNVEAVGYVNGVAVFRQTRETAGPASALRLTPITGPGGFKATGSDVLLVDVEAVDTQGRRCPTWQARVDFELQGPGIWRGGYNSGKAGSINHPWLDLEAGINRVAIRSTRQAGSVTLSARTDGLRSAALTVPVLEASGSNGFLDELPELTPVEVPETAPVPTQKDQELLAGKTQPSSPSMTGRYIAELAYSGSGKAELGDVMSGVKLFTDHDILLEKVPSVLEGGEMIRLPNQEWNYSAVDLLQFEVSVPADVYIARDSRLPPMPWLVREFQNCGETLRVKHHVWDLWKRTVKKNESVLLGSNTEGDGEKRWQMIVFVVPAQTAVSALANPTDASPAITLFMKDGGWCWYQDPRAILHDGKLFIGSVKGNGDGEALIGVYDLKSKTALGNVVANPKFDRDDHNSPVFFARTDGSVLAMYARHSRDHLHRFRISDPNDPMKWSEEMVFNHDDPKAGKVTYMNLLEMTAEGKLYNFYRGIRWNPSFITSTDQGKTWGEPTHFISSELNGTHRPYVRYAGNGKDRVYVSFTDGHPRDFGNSIYYAEFSNGKFCKADGTLLKDLKKDGPLRPSEAERVYRGSETREKPEGCESVPFSAWTSSISIDAKGNPHIGYTLYLSNTDHRYRIASWDGNRWFDREVAYAGKCLYERESSYTGLITLDPVDPSVVFISTDVDPSTGKESGGLHEIYRANIGLNHDVASIKWTAVTENSKVRNIRPVVLRDGDSRVVLWNCGRFTTYTDYDLDTVGFVEDVK